ncbi:MAG: hypothetical protein WAZ40_01015 [Minisyncoccia bacterium]
MSIQQKGLGKKSGSTTSVAPQKVTHLPRVNKEFVRSEMQNSIPHRVSGRSVDQTSKHKTFYGSVCTS